MRGGNTEFEAAPPPAIANADVDKPDSFNNLIALKIYLDPYKFARFVSIICLPFKYTSPFPFKSMDLGFIFIGISTDS